MSFAHLRTILWLRWRLTLNQIRKESLISRIFSIAVLLIGGLSVFGSVSSIFSLGFWVFPSQPPWWLAYLWDGVAVAFLIGWVWNIIAELQQRESLSLEKFLHLPVAPWNIVWLNYFASWFNLTLVFFVPSALALSIVVGLRYGGWLWLTPFLTVAFFFMITAITWQFRGWMTSLMRNPRRRSLLVALGTTALIIVLMLPAGLDRLLSDKDDGPSPRKQLRLQRQQLEANLAAENIDDEEFAARLADIQAAEKILWEDRKQQFIRAVDWGNLVLPVGWLPHGVASAQQGKPWISLACLGGMTAIGVVSLWRAGSTSLRVHTQAGTNKRQATRAIEPLGSGPELGLARKHVDLTSVVTQYSAPSIATPGNWLEWRWPWLTEPQSAVASGTFRNLARAMEVKVAMFWPALVLVILGGTGSVDNWFTQSGWLSSLVALGFVSFTAMGATQLIQNQFGFDRDGIRSFLLLPIEPKDVLIGKNFAIFPAAIALGLTALLLLQLIRPLWLSHLLATAIQLQTSLLIFCLVGNLVSILTPLPLKPGSLQPARIDFKSAILQILLFMLVPLGMIPAFIPLGLEWLVRDQPGWNVVPIYFIGSALYLVVVSLAYRWLIVWEGDWFGRRLGSIARSVSRTE